MVREFQQRKKRVAVSSLMVLITLVQCTSKNTIKVNKNIEFLWILYVVWMSHTMDNQTWPVLPVFRCWNPLTMQSALQLMAFVPNTTNNDIAAHFLLHQHFWPCLNNVLHQWSTRSHRRSVPKKKRFSHECKNGPPYPRTPAWRHNVVTTPYNHDPSKMGRNTLHNNFSHRYIDPVYGLLNVL